MNYYYKNKHGYIRVPFKLEDAIKQGFQEVNEAEFLNKKESFNINNEVSLQINTLINKLVQTDYIDNKLTEALTIYNITGNKTRLEAVYNQYADILEEREQIRQQISVLKDSL